MVNPQDFLTHVVFLPCQDAIPITLYNKGCKVNSSTEILHYSQQGPQPDAGQGALGVLGGEVSSQGRCGAALSRLDGTSRHSDAAVPSPPCRPPH